MSNRWPQIKNFNKDENWGDYKKMKLGFLLKLDDLRSYIGRRINIHRGYSADRKGSQHYDGIATDLDVEGISLVDAYLAAERFGFNGIGVYDESIWNNPGLHLDDRLNHARWGCRWKRDNNGIGMWKIKDGKKHKAKEYVALDSTFIKNILEG